MNATKTASLLFILKMLVLFCPFSQSAHASRSDSGGSSGGLPSSTYFSPADYSAGLQNWAFIEDPRGILYVGNAAGVLEYDGLSWELIPLPNHRDVRSLACDSTGRTWVGGSGEIGYLAADSIGRTAYVSLLDEVPDGYRDFHTVWSTFATSDGIYFKTDIAIFRWSGAEMKVWPASPKWHMSFFIDGEFYVRKKGKGLLRMEKSDSTEYLQLVPGGEQLANLYTYFMHRYDEQQLLVGTREKGLFLYDGNTFRKFATEADSLLQEGRIFSPPGILLPGHGYGIGTLSNGLVIINTKGELIRHLNTETGLRDNTILSSFVDKKGNVWLGHSKGITRLAFGSPFSHFGADSGLNSWISTVATYDEKLFVGDFEGLHVLDPSVNQFKHLSPSVTEVFALLPTSGFLLAGSAKLGLYQVTENVAELIPSTAANDYQVLSLHQWEANPDYVFAGLKDGLAVLYRDGADWIDQGRIPGLNFDITGIEEDDRGDLWLGTGANGIIRVHLSALANGVPDIHRFDRTIYGPEDGLIAGLLTPFMINNTLYVTGLNETVFVFDRNAMGFIKTSAFDEAKTGNPIGSFKLREDSSGNVWITSTYGVASIAYLQSDGSYRLDVLHYLSDKQIVDVHPFANGRAWFIGVEELIRYDLKFDLAGRTRNKPLIRQVVRNQDQLLYGGLGPSNDIETMQGPEAIGFWYLSPGEQVQPRFRTRLIGFDKKWSSWSKNMSQSYNNLPPGVYAFQVESEGNGDTSVSFTVLPKWYRTGWAYLSYLLLFALVLEVARRMVKRRVQLQEQKKFELIQARNSLSEKETLLREIHHRVKNNLQLVSGILELQASKVNEKALRENLFECQKRLSSMALIHEQLYNGKNLSEISFKEYIATLVTDITIAYGDKKKNIEAHVEVGDITFDISTAVPLGLIINELITNTFKHAFSNKRKGNIHLTLNRLQDEDYQLEVRDDGQGMPAGFDFRKASSLGYRLINGLTRQLEGNCVIQNGIGTTVIINFKDVHHHEPG